MDIHVAPLLLGDGVRLFEPGGVTGDLEATRVISSLKVTHMTYRRIGG